MKACLLGTLNDRKVYRFPVDVIRCRGLLAKDEDRLHVIAHTARDAAKWVHEQVKHLAQTEIVVYGPRGGTAAYHWVGWETATSALFDKVRCRYRDQLKLPL